MPRLFSFSDISRLNSARLLTLLALAIAIVASTACTDNGTEPEFSDDERIQETTLRFMTALNWNSWYAFATFATSAGTPFDNRHGELTAVSFRLYDRLQNIDHPMRPYAECTLGMGGVFHPDFKSNGICLWVGPVTRTGAGSAIVYAGYYVGGLGAAGYLVRVENGRDDWEVVGFRLLWIS